MRLDKYLKVSRLIKRRTTAKEVADNSRILVNSREAKPSTTVSINDIISIRLGLKIIVIKVTSIEEHTRKDDAKFMYQIIEEKRINEENAN